MSQPDGHGHSYSGPAIPMRDVNAVVPGQVPEGTRVLDSPRLHRAETKPFL
jgi:hypothetical protein